MNTSVVEAWFSWAVPCSEALSSPFLTETERRGLGAKRHNADRMGSASARVLLKTLLWQQFGIAPGSLELVATSRTANHRLCVPTCPTRQIV